MCGSRRKFLERTAESYRKVRNTLRFLLANLGDFDPRRHRVPLDQLTELDRWMWTRYQQLLAEVTEAYETLQFSRVVRAINTFCVVDLSSMYLDALKDGLYTEAPNAPQRRSAQTVLSDMVVGLLTVLAPILSFTADEAWEHLTAREEREPSVHLARWPRLAALHEEPSARERWERILSVRAEVLKALEAARSAELIGGALEAQVTIAARSDDELRQLTADQELVTILTIVSGLEVVSAGDGPRVKIQRAKGRKCLRCWMFRESVGRDATHPELCDRCVTVIGAIHDQTRTPRL